MPHQAIPYHEGFAAHLTNFPDHQQKIRCSLRREVWSQRPNLSGVFDASQWSNSLQIAKIPCNSSNSREFGVAETGSIWAASTTIKSIT
jgi:hypothetical protein